MRLRVLFYFLTLVLVFQLPSLSVEAAPNTNIPPSGIDTRPAPKRENSTRSQNLDESVRITTPEAPKDTYAPRKLWNPSPRNHALGVGYGSGIYNKDKEAKTAFIGSYVNTNYKKYDQALEYGFELTDIGYVGLQYGYKWLCCSSEFYEPFYKIAAAAYYDPKDFLANVVNFQRYLVRGSVGFENLFHTRRHLRLELAAGVGPLGLTLGAHLFYTFPSL